MKDLILIACTMMLLGCGGSLSEDQRKRLHEGMEQQKIVKLTDSEILTASLERGRAIFLALENVKFDGGKVDSVAGQYHARLRWITPGSPDAQEIENQLIEAYVIGAETGSTQDNIQKIHLATGAEEYDSLLYSRPVVTPMADGALNVEGVWNIYISKKDVILSVGKTQ